MEQPENSTILFGTDGQVELTIWSDGEVTLDITWPSDHDDPVIKQMELSGRELQISLRDRWA